MKEITKHRNPVGGIAKGTGEMTNTEGFELDEVNNLVGAIVGWLGEQAAAGVTRITLETIRAEFAGDGPLEADILEEAISAIEHAPRMIVWHE